MFHECRDRLLQAPPRAIARDLAAGVVHLRMPVTHRRAIPTMNLPERLFEERRPLKNIPRAKLMLGVMIRAGERSN